MNSRRRRCSVCIAAVLLVPSAVVTAQTTYAVSGGGAALQNVINAAAPGDTLDVMLGIYSQVTVTRGLRIIMSPGAVGAPLRFVWD